MINSVFVMSGTGEVLIEKHYRGVVSRTCCDLFWNEVLGATACASGGVWGSGACVCVCVCMCVCARARTKLPSLVHVHGIHVVQWGVHVSVSMHTPTTVRIRSQQHATRSSPSLLCSGLAD